jgi:hypothetical protein
MASHTAVLSMIAALAITSVHEIPWRQARAYPGPSEGFSQAAAYAPASKDMGTKDVSREGVLGSETMAQNAGPDMPVARPPVPLLRQPRRASTSRAQPETPGATAEEDEEADALDMEAAKAAIERDALQEGQDIGQGRQRWLACQGLQGCGGSVPERRFPRRRIRRMRRWTAISAR